jgi:hypothetical protein
MKLFDWLMNRKLVYLLLEFGLDKLFIVDVLLFVTVISLACVYLILPLDAIGYVTVFFAFSLATMFFCTFIILAVFIHYE